MTKKKQPIEVAKESPTDFDQLCLDFRAKKIAAEIAAKALNMARTKLNEYVISHEIGKGNYSGVNIQEKFKFLPSNVDVALAAHLTVPMIVEQRLKLSEERIKTLIAKGTLKSDEVEKIETPDWKKLEALMAEKKVTAEYEKSYAYGLGKE